MSDKSKTTAAVEVENKQEEEIEMETYDFTEEEERMMWQGLFDMLPWIRWYGVSERIKNEPLWNEWRVIGKVDDEGRAIIATERFHADVIAIGEVDQDGNIIEIDTFTIDWLSESEYMDDEGLRQSYENQIK
jgi:hypothetical protein